MLSNRLRIENFFGLINNIDFLLYVYILFHHEQNFDWSIKSPNS